MFDTKSHWGTWRPNKFLQFLIKLIDKFPVNNIAKRIVFSFGNPSNTVNNTASI